MLGDLEVSNVTGQIFYREMFCLDRQTTDNKFSLIKSFNKYFLNAYSLGTREVIRNKTEKSFVSQDIILG